MSYIVIVSDCDLSGSQDATYTVDETEVIGPFPTEQAALDWAWQEPRWLVAVREITWRPAGDTVDMRERIAPYVGSPA